MDDEMLKAYLQNHWVASTTGTAVFRRVGRTHGDPKIAEQVAALAEEVAADREALRAIMRSVGVEPSRVGTALAKGAATLGQLKPNGRIIRRSPLTDVLELEALRIAVCGKAAGWDVLSSVAVSDDRLDRALLADLVERATRQLRVLESLHVSVAQLRTA